MQDELQIEIENLLEQEKEERFFRRFRRLMGTIRFQLAPTVEECLTMLDELETSLGSERDLAQVLGPSIITVRSWRRRKRMSVPARRVVWLTWALVLHPETIRNILDLVTWGLHGRAKEGVQVSSEG